MSQNSVHLSLPYIQGGQAQKHITHNDAIQVLDTVVQLSVRDQVATPVGDPTEGDRYIVADGATGDYTGEDGKIALFETGIWQFMSPKTGWTAYDETLGQQIAYDGAGWVMVGGSGGINSTDRLGINATADSTNRLTSASDATLLTHDAAGGHQLKVNKEAATDTASLLFQTGYSGRAEMGITGSDDFEVKVSPDGSSFLTALQVDGATGAISMPYTSLSPSEFGDTSLITQDYTISRGAGMVSNGTGYLANAYNYPPSFLFDAAETPNLPGSFSKAGHYTGAEEMAEFVALDPNNLYRLGVYIRQESAAGDWLAFTNEDRHIQYMGFRCYDVDGNTIEAPHHTRYHHAGTDSLTTLTQPLAPGHTTVHVADASGWNENVSNSYERGLVIFGYKNSLDRPYEYYSRIEDFDLFELGGVDKTAHEITLNQPLPPHLGNPDDPAGLWPVGTRIANRGVGWNFKFGFFSDLVLSATDQWFQVQNAMGGVDLSGKNVPHNFPPGTALVRPVWLMNYSNRVGGYSSYPDTGSDQRTWVTGVSIDVDHSGAVTREPDGSCSLKVVEGNPATGAVTFAAAAMKVSET